jgi:trans-2-enoyl-CoA reductase
MLAAPITPTDLSKVEGFATSAATPAVGGTEGVGVVEKVGSGVSHVKAGDKVVVAGKEVGTWASHVVSDASNFVAVPASAKDVADEQLSTAVVSPIVAERLLSDFVDLKSGDVIIQNNAGSTVGQCVVQWAAARGIKTINIMAMRDDWDNAVAHFHSLGANIVVSEEYARTPEFAALIADLPAPTLGLNSVGGEAAIAVAKKLAPGSTMVTFGSVGRHPVTLPLDVFVEKDITCKGFNVEAWMSKVGPEETHAAVNRAVSALGAGKMTQLLAREPFADFGVALDRAMEPHERKVVVTF